MLRKIIPFVVVLSVFLLVSCVTTSDKYLETNGDYLDYSFTRTITVRQIEPLANFGVTSKEWEDLFADSLLYKAHGLGNGYMSEATVQQMTYEAIRITGKNQNMRYYAIFGKLRDKDHYSDSFANLNYDKYSFDCYVLFFNDLDFVPTIRECFGNINVYNVN